LEKENTMAKLTIDAQLPEKLCRLEETVELCDEIGQVVGVFTPAPDIIRPEGWEPTITREKVERWNKEKGGTSLEQLLTRLEGE
jgi:hypothetical protein